MFKAKTWIGELFDELRCISRTLTEIKGLLADNRGLLKSVLEKMDRAEYLRGSREIKSKLCNSLPGKVFVSDEVPDDEVWFIRGSDVKKQKDKYDLFDDNGMFKPIRFPFARKVD